MMQQLGAGLVSFDDGLPSFKLAVEWLQSLAYALDPNDRRIEKHVGGVCEQVVVYVTAKISAVVRGGGGNLAVRRPLQMLVRVIRGIESVK